MSGPEDNVGMSVKFHRDVAAIDAAIIRVARHLAGGPEVALPAASALVAIGLHAAGPLAVALRRARSVEERAMIIAVMAHLDPTGPRRGPSGPGGDPGGEGTLPRKPGSPRGRARRPRDPGQP